MTTSSISLAERLTLMTAREAASYLRVSLSTLHRMEQRGDLTPLRTPGGHRRYTLVILNDSLRAELASENSHSPAMELAA